MPATSASHGLGITYYAGYPLRVHFQIPCVFSVYSLSHCNFFCVPIYVICYHFIKKNWKFSRQILMLSFTFRVREFTTWNSLCFGKISKFPVFSLTGNFWGPFPLFSLCSGYPVTGVGVKFYPYKKRPRRKKF